MPRKRRGNNKIDASDASEVADYVSALQEQLQELDDDAIESVFFGQRSYAKVTSVRVAYETTVEVVKGEGQNQRTKERAVEVSIDLDIIDSPVTKKVAPFKLVNGVIGPAESSRHAVEEILSKFLSSSLDSHPPVFCVSANTFWVLYDRYYIINIENKNVVVINTLVELRQHLKPMEDWISDNLETIYG